MRYFILLLSLLLTSLLGGCSAYAGANQQATVQFKPTGAEGFHVEGHNEPMPYDREANAANDINQALAAAKVENKKAILVFGANWCHDSRALAAHFEKPKFQTLIQNNYKLTYIDVGQKNRNIDLAQKFGVESIIGSPTVFITNSDGKVLNAKTAPSWRNAASREEDAVWDYFLSYAK